MTFKATLTILVLAIAQLHADPRPWKSADGQRSFLGDYIKRDAASVTVRRSEDGKQVTIPLDMLHPDDRSWLDATYPVPATRVSNTPLPDPSDVFDRLNFGDSRADVLKKLKASKFVQMTLDETFIGRSGLNGVFRTRQKIGGLDASLYFGWTDNNELSEITLQTDALPEKDFQTKLVPCWKDFAILLTKLQGKPIVADKEIHLASIQDGSLMSTHLWKLDKVGSARLGAARDGTKFQIVVRFTKDEVKPVALP